MIQKEVGLYSGWGVEPSARNFGDELCDIGARRLLEEIGITHVTGVRNSINPVTEKWDKPLIIGGGTVLPTVFESWVGPGLKYANPIFVLGSGVLSPRELENKDIAGFDHDPYANVIPIGVRGPLSSDYYHTYFNVKPSYIGDLTFYFAQQTLVEQSKSQVSYFLIENENPASRLTSDLEQIMSSFTEIAGNLKVEDLDQLLCLTDDNEKHDWFNMASESFDQVIKVRSLEKYISSITESRLVITERLHPAIIAANYGIPFLYFQTTSKSIDLEALFESVGVDKSINDCLFIDQNQNLDSHQHVVRGKMLIYEKNVAQTLLHVSNEIKISLRDSLTKNRELIHSHVS